MPNARIIAAADALANALAAAELSQSFTAARVYVPEYEKKDLGEIKIALVPKGEATTQSVSRLRVEDLHQIDVGIHRLAAADDLGALDALMLFVDEVADFIRNNGPYGTAVWLSTESPMIYDQAKLTDEGIFLSVKTFNFRLYH